MIENLPPDKKTFVLKLYEKAFVNQSTPCPSCTNHCCVSCGYSGGHQRDKTKLATLKEKYEFVEPPVYTNGMETYKSKQGFFVPGKGCALPVEERSALCVSFTCKKMTQKQRSVGRLIEEYLYV